MSVAQSGRPLLADSGAGVVVSKAIVAACVSAYTIAGEDNMTPIRVQVAAIALSIAFGSVDGTGLTQRPAKDQDASRATPSSKRMADGKEWTTANLNLNVDPSFCYDNAEPNCRRYGRMYTWESAQRVCPSLGGGWRLPTDDEWRQARAFPQCSSSGSSRDAHGRQGPFRR